MMRAIEAPLRAAGIGATACTGDGRARASCVRCTGAPRVSHHCLTAIGAERDRRKLLLDCELLAGRQGFDPITWSREPLTACRPLSFVSFQAVSLAVTSVRSVPLRSVLVQRVSLCLSLRARSPRCHQPSDRLPELLIERCNGISSPRASCQERTRVARRHGGNGLRRPLESGTGRWIRRAISKQLASAL